MALIRFENACLGYQRPVIGPLNFSLSAGERIGIWGPNGCGKSTLLKYFTSDSRLISGNIEKPAELTIAYQPQNPEKPMELPITGEEYLQLMSANTSGLPQKLHHCLTQRLDQLSGGQFQLLSTWANLASEGQLVLLDEPTNNLDPDSVALLTETILAMPLSHSLIVVSHEKEFIEAVASRVVELC